MTRGLRRLKNVNNKRCLFLSLLHVACLCSQVKAKFDQINEMTTNKAYERQIVKGCYAVECGLEDGEDTEVRMENDIVVNIF